MYATCLENLQLEEKNSFLDIGSGCGLLTLVRPFFICSYYSSSSILFFFGGEFYSTVGIPRFTKGSLFSLFPFYLFLFFTYCPSSTIPLPLQSIIHFINNDESLEVSWLGKVDLHLDLT